MHYLVQNEATVLTTAELLLFLKFDPSLLKIQYNADDA